MPQKSTSIYNKGLDLPRGIKLETIFEGLPQKGHVMIPMISPKNEGTYIRLESWIKKGCRELIIDTRPSNWDISENGENEFIAITATFGDEIKNRGYGKNIMRLSYIKNSGPHEIEWLEIMLSILANPKNIKEVCLPN